MREPSLREVICPCRRVPTRHVRITKLPYAPWKPMLHSPQLHGLGGLHEAAKRCPAASVWFASIIRQLCLRHWLPCSPPYSYSAPRVPWTPLPASPHQIHIMVLRKKRSSQENVPSEREYQLGLRRDGGISPEYDKPSLDVLIKDEHYLYQTGHSHRHQMDGYAL